MAGLETLVSQAWPRLGDDVLQERLQTYCACLKEMFRVNERMISWLAGFLGLPAVQDNEDRYKLHRRLSGDARRHMEKYRAGPGGEWGAETEYQALLGESKQALIAAGIAKKEAIRRLGDILGEDTRLLPADQWPDLPLVENEPASTVPEITGPGGKGLTAVGGSSPSGLPAAPEQTTSHRNEFGDQRAKDLVDEASGMPDNLALQSIEMLRKALRYGRTGIQASKAYLGLAERYEDLGDENRAIHYYTRSLEAWRPSATTLFRRGMLFYRHGEWNKARVDLEQALVLGLGSPEDEEAERVLAELDVLLGGNVFGSTISP